MAIYFFDKNQTLMKIVPESATFEAIQTQELDDDSLLKDTLSVTVKGDEKLLNAEYMAVKSYKGNAQTFDMYRIVTDTTPDKSMSFTGMSLAPYELNGHIIQDLRPANHSLSYTLNRVLDGTDWRVGYIDDGLSNVTTTFYYVSAKEALKELQSLVGCEFVFKVEISGQKITDKWVEVYREMGNRTKKRFNYGTNALTVVRETNKADIFTALIGRGKGEEVSSADDNESGQAGYGRKITFEDIEWKKSSGKPLDKPKGQYYLELPQATQAYGIKNIDGTMKARVGIVDFDDEEDKNRLINLTYQQLLVSSRPKVLFKTTVANIGATGIGDTVTIHRHDLNIHYQTRVRKIVRNKLNDNKTQIELGDAVVTASTKQTKQNNATIKNLNNEIDKIKANVTTSQNSADGKNTIFYGSAEPERQRTGDTWYRPHPSIAGETQMLTWNGTAWELVIDTSDLTSVSKAVEDASRIAGEAVQAAKDADTKANDALVKAGANANLLDTHQNTLNTISNTTLPDINKSLSDAISDAQSALSSASSAMAEAKKADGKIANYVTKNGLVNGTTVDSKIDTATGAISRKITAVEGKIPTTVGGRNYALKSNAYYFTTDYKVSEYNLSKIPKGTKIKISLWGGLDSGARTFGAYINNGSGLGSDNSQKIELTKLSGLYGQGRSTSLSKWTAEATLNVDASKILIFGLDNDRTTPKRVEYVKVETGGLFTDWTAAPEDNYTQEEFKIFESTYDEDVKGIRSSLSSLENDKLDGSTYTTFYKNEYEKTAQGVKDAYEKIGKVVDENGNTTDTFAKAVYEKTATSRTADFNEVTKDLVTTATYSEGVKGINQSITTIRGDLDSLSGGGRNYAIDTSNAMKYYIKINTYSGLLDQDNKLTTKTKYTLSELDAKVGDWYTASIYIGQGGGYGSSVTVYNQNTRSIRLRGNRAVQGYSSVTFQVLEGDTEFNFYLGNESGNNSIYQIEAKEFQIEKGKIRTAWKPAISEQMGKAEFTIFKNDYEETAESVERRLTAIDSDEDGSFATRLNKTESTASGNNKLITTINSNYVTQKNIDETILSDKQIKDTRNDNQLPSWYMTNYPKQQIREFKLSSTMGLKTDTSGTYGILTTDVQWGDSSGGTVKQQFVNDDATFTRTGNSNGASWGAWATQVDTSNKTYQKVTETSSLYERVLGSDEKEVNSKVARIVQTSDVIKTEVAKMDLSETNYVLNSDEYVWTTSYHVKSYDLADEIPKGTKIKISVWGGLSAGVRTFGMWFNNSSGLSGDNSQVVDLVQQTGSYGQGREYPLQKWTAEITLNVPASKILIYGRDNNTTASKRIEYVQIETGATFTPWKPSSKGLSSTITQLADNINLKVSKDDLISQINVQAKGVLITSGTNKLNVTPETTYIKDGTIESAMIKSLDAGKITAGTLDASKATITNIDASNITANVTAFMRTNWQQANGQHVRIDGTGMYTSGTGDWRRTYFTPTGMDLFNGQGSKAGAIGYFKASRDYTNGNYGDENIMWGDRLRHTIGVGVNYNHVLSLGYVSSSASIDNGYNDALTISPQNSGKVSIHTSLDMLSRPIENAYRLNFRHGGYIFGQQDSSMYYNASLRHDLAIAGSTKFAVDGTIRAYTGIDMNGNDIARVGKLTYNSDQRLKTNIKDTSVKALDAIRNWQLVSYDWLENGEHVEVGLIAQNTPELMTYDVESDIYGIDAGKQTMINTMAIQQLDSKVDNKVEQLEAKIASLQEELALLKGD